MKKTKEQIIEQMCKEDNELRHQYMSGKISKKEYNKKKKILHEKYSKLTDEEGKILDLVKLIAHYRKKK